MSGMKSIGIFTSFAEPAALELIDEVITFINQEYKDQAGISFIFSNREAGENPATDQLLEKVGQGPVPLIVHSAARFDPEQRKAARQAAKKGDQTALDQWRNDYAEAALQLLPPTDFDLLLGDWWIWGSRLCEKRTALNLHPALPDGPKGEWFNVIWDLIEQEAQESGVMMHKVTPELDEGPVATYCRYAIRGPLFDDLWAQLPTDQAALQQLIKKESAKRELTDYPLHAAIRREGFKREVPLILSTAAALIDNEFTITGSSVQGKDGHVLAGGYDVTATVEDQVTKK